MPIRPYISTDADALLLLFQRHVPHAFGADEAAEYAEFLRINTDPYFVAEHDGRVVGACGHYVKTGPNPLGRPDSQAWPNQRPDDLSDGQTARIGWIFTDPDVKGVSVGSALVRHNLNVIKQYPGVRRIECRTSQVAYRFFEKFGFRVQYTESDFWAPGLDLYFMTTTT